jgi:ADP-ribose pyrophosphatase YjhB (NUDIX family)
VQIICFVAIALTMSQLWHFFRSAFELLLHHPVTGTSIIPLLPDGRIVLIRRRDNGQWGLPGGTVDWGEDIPSTVRREIEEETGLTVTQINRLVGVYSSPQRDPRFHSICVVVEAQVEGDFAIRDSIEIMDVKAFERAEIPLGSLSHDHDQQLQDYFNGQTTLA